ncbi:MAG TPA: 4-demethylwyosine synthase TYW1 [Candidatus Nanopusillus sp.]|nr:4-demethylwyosine synthase TYW1 [Candidatus Nanopusillus sp.]
MVSDVLIVPPSWRSQLEKAGYAIYNHSAVEICHWTKKSLKDKGDCYKNRFYRVDTWGCMQITQAVIWCPNRCIYCWRPNEEFESNIYMLPKEKVDPPEVTLEELRKLRKELLIGFKGNSIVNKDKLDKTLEKPTHITFSLAGEPLLYPYVPESILYIKKNWPLVKSIFVVTNGLVPEALERMVKLNAYPTQLYISFTAPNPELYKKISRSLYIDYWERFIKSLKIASKMKTRRVARITIIKGLNDARKLFEQWIELLDILNPHFIEVKAFMLLGYSRYRLSIVNMPSHKYIVQWSKEFVEHLDGFEYWDEHKHSRVALLKNRKFGMDIDPIIKSVEPNV